MNEHEEYCIACGQDGPLRREQKATEFDIRGETLRFTVPVKVCPSCGATEAEGVDPAEIAFAEYRKLKGLLTPEQIREIRDRYRLSQKSFAALLGMSEATINRYEGGGIQDEAYDAALRACKSPEFVRTLLQRNGHRLSDWQRRRMESALEHKADDAPEIPLSGQMHRMPDEASLRTGYRRFNFDRYAAVVVWFCGRLRTVTPTSLNKLLFYADFLHFRTHAVSLTGAAYRRLPYGPVPADYGGLREQLELDQIVETREVKWQNGNVGEEYHVGPRARELETSFSASELEVLETVAEAFAEATPSQLSDRSHAETAWKDTKDRTLISYEKAAELSFPTPV
jgi:putative zinc finger/helix-turn-helix YgiT family protein